MSAFRIFDEDDDGCIHAGDLVDVLTTFGEKLTKSEAKKLVQTADKREGGLIDYEGEFWIFGTFVIMQNYDKGANLTWQEYKLGNFQV